MKIITPYLIYLLLLTTLSCSIEDVNQEDPFNLDANFRTFQYSEKDVNLNSARNVITFCTETNLIAGQNYIAGTVNVQLDGDDLVITYTTNSDWTIHATHLSIGNCDEQSIPTNGGGNPKVGHFEHSTENDNGTVSVVYILDASVLDDNYCFAAHAEVSGPTGGETAWAEGINFEGNNWAMYVEALLSDCENTEGEL